MWEREEGCVVGMLEREEGCVVGMHALEGGGLFGWHACPSGRRFAFVLLHVLHQAGHPLSPAHHLQSDSTSRGCLSSRSVASSSEECGKKASVTFASEEANQKPGEGHSKENAKAELLRATSGRGSTKLLSDAL